MKRRLVHSKAECFALVAGRKRGRIYRYQNGQHNMFFAVDEEESNDESLSSNTVPRKFWSSAHCIMQMPPSDASMPEETPPVSPLVFDVDAHWISETGTPSLDTQKTAKYAIFAMIRLVIETVVGKQHTDACTFAFSDASGLRTLTKSDQMKSCRFKFSYHIVVRPPKGIAFECGSSLALCAVLNAQMRFNRWSNTPLARLIENRRNTAANEQSGKKDNYVHTLEHEEDLFECIDEMKNKIKSVFSDYGGNFFDEQIYKSLSLRTMGAKTPRGDCELLPVNLDTGVTEGSVWELVSCEERDELRRLHDPYPSREEIDAFEVFDSNPSAIIQCKDMILPHLDGNAVMDLTNGKQNGNQETMTLYSKPSTLRLRCTENAQQMNRMCSKLVKLCAQQIPNSKIPNRQFFDCRGSFAKMTDKIRNLEYYEVRSRLSFCPWKSARQKTNECSCDHGKNKILIRVYPMGADEQQRLHVKLLCFSEKCVASMNGKGAAIVEYPQAGQAGSLDFLSTMRALFKILSSI